MDEVRRKLIEAIEAAARRATGPEPAELRRRLRRRRQRGAVAALALLLGAGIALPNLLGPRDSRVAAPPPARQLTCGDIPFPETSLHAPPGAEAGRDPAARALVAFLASDAARDPWVLPKTGWKVLARNDDRALYGLGKPGTVTFAVRVRRQGTHWKWIGYGGCRPRVVKPGLEATSWRLASRALDPGTRAVTVSFVTGECVGFDHAEVATTAGAVTIVVFLRRTAPAGQACAGIGYQSRHQVALPEPLGRRALVDGGIVPPEVVRPA